MDKRIYQNIMAFKTPAGKILGLHSRNLEVAELSEEIWASLTDTQSESEALLELQDWSQEASHQTHVSAPDYIKSLSINVTQVCNLHCTYCAAGGDGTYGSPTKKIAVEKTIPQIKWLMDRLPSNATFSINFLGGEPLLYPEALSAIGEYALSYAQTSAPEKNIRVQFNVVTNGTLFTEKSIAELKKINCSITLSLDGPPEINDRVRPTLTGAGATQKILEGLKLLLSSRQGIGSIGVQAVFGKHNCEVVKAYQFFRELGLDWYEFNYDQTNSDAVSSEKFERELTAVAALAPTEVELRKIKFFNQVFTHIDSQRGLNNFCGSGKSYLVLDAQNRAFTCPWEVNDPKLAVGSGTELDLKKMQHLDKTQLEANNCGTCWARHLCGGGCMYAHKKVTGSKHNPDVLYCDRTRNLLSTAIMHYESIRSSGLQ